MGDDFVVTSSSGASEYSWRILAAAVATSPRHSLELVKQGVRNGEARSQGQVSLEPWGPPVTDAAGLGRTSSGRPEAEPGSRPGRVLLAVYAHPDDPDISCGGTLALWSAAGSDVHVCLCCDGDKGSLDASVDGQTLVRDRRQETEAAGREIGVGAHHWLGYHDGEVDDSSDLRARLVALVRRLRPDAVLAPDPTAVFFGPNYINHRDHRMVGWAVIDAVSPAAANPHYFPGR